MINLTWHRDELFHNNVLVAVVADDHGTYFANIQLPRWFAVVRGANVAEFIANAKRRGINIILR